MKIFAIGMNYAAHNKELQRLRVGDRSSGIGTLKRPDEPVIFTKADSALLKPGKPFFVPDHLGRIDYEAEVVVRICRLGKNIPVRFAHRYYDAMTVGIDFTARDLQRRASEAGQPWTICKGFDGSAAIGEWVEIRGYGGTGVRGCEDSSRYEVRGTRCEDSSRCEVRGTRYEDSSGCEVRGTGDIHFHLDKNGETVQVGCMADMLYSVDEIIAYISQFFTLKTGDLLYTGTPAGVGPVGIGDHLEGWLEDQKVLDLNCR